jgi:hypothetical protein
MPAYVTELSLDSKCVLDLVRNALAEADITNMTWVFCHVLSFSKSLDMRMSFYRDDYSGAMGNLPSVLAQDYDNLRTQGSISYGRWLNIGQGVVVLRTLQDLTDHVFVSPVIYRSFPHMHVSCE